MPYGDILQRHRAGRVVSSSEASQLQVTYEKSTKSYLDTLTEIEGREKELEDLRAKSARLRKLITALSAPIRKLPSEVLSRILEYSMESRLFTLQFPHRLFLLPRCHAVFTRNLVGVQAAYAKDLWHESNSQLWRSAIAPPTVQIMYMTFAIESVSQIDAQAASQMIDVVVPHAARWKMLIIQGFRDWDPLTPSLTPITSFPLLESPLHARYLRLSGGFAHGSNIQHYHDVTTPDSEGLNCLQAAGEMPNVVSLSYDFQLDDDVPQTPIIPQISNSVDHLCLRLKPGVLTFYLVSSLPSLFPT
ncbi:hypothetical protein D9758_010736 [Tetrapyrgos nigripes]|uniref:Uncharacterized protein n=1 Tax=Tetrapyrgos nigripes TaxID=182062 RepID=A0A8H5D736_9AGAR|nr:hypothetical protein D9758_010736 [Tetrapyrgos nigripes]